MNSTTASITVPRRRARRFLTALTALGLVLLGGCIKDPGTDPSQTLDPASSSEVEPQDEGDGATDVTTGAGLGQPIGAVPTALPDLTAEPVLSPLISANTPDVSPWWASPAVIDGANVLIANELSDVTGDVGWSKGPGLTAFDLANGDQKWHVTYADLGMEEAAAPDTVSAQALSDKDGTVAVLASMLVCPDQECDEDAEENFVVAAISWDSGEVISTVKAAGTYPTLVAADHGVVVYSTDGESVVAAKTAKLDGAPVWQTETIDANPDGVIDDAVFAGGKWRLIATGADAPLKADLDEVDSYTIATARAIITSTGDGTEHVVGLVDGVTGEALWQAKVNQSDEETESVWVTDDTIVLAYDTDEASRTVALDRKTGEQLWIDDSLSAWDAGAGWILAENEAGWTINSARDGNIVATLQADPEVGASVVFKGDLAYIAAGGKLEALALAGAQKSDQPLWSVDIASDTARVTTELGPLAIVLDESGQVQVVAPGA